MATTSRSALLGLLASALAAGAAPAQAADAPHDVSTGTTCKSCHTMHRARGASLTNEAVNATLCASCHNQAQSPRLGFPWVSGDQAVPGASGQHHRWDAPATNADAGALPPSHAKMALEVEQNAGVLNCSVCHDQHAVRPENQGGSQHTSVPTGVPLQNTSGSGHGTLTLTVGGAAIAKGYRIRVSADGRTFAISHDYGLPAPTFLEWSGSGWTAPVGSGAGRPFTLGADVATDDPAVLVRFGGAPQPGDSWDFYVSYPYLRAPNVASAMCEDCHRDRVQSSVRVAGADPAFVPDGVKRFSHPVGEALSRSYDRTGGAQGGLRDANGAEQGTAGADANASNDLSLDAGGAVRCMSCHYPHGADSNSLTEDPR